MSMAGHHRTDPSTRLAGPAFAADRARWQASGWEPPEVVGRLAWRTQDEATAARVAQGSGVLGLSGPPMVSSFGRGRGGRPTQLLDLEAVAVERSLVDAQIRVNVSVV